MKATPITGQQARYLEIDAKFDLTHDIPGSGPFKLLRDSVSAQDRLTIPIQGVFERSDTGKAVDRLLRLLRRPVRDAAKPSDKLFALQSDYIAPGYFAQDYVGTLHAL